MITMVLCKCSDADGTWLFIVDMMTERRFQCTIPCNCLLPTIVSDYQMCIIVMAVDGFVYIKQCLYSQWAVLGGIVWYSSQATVIAIDMPDSPKGLSWICIDHIGWYLHAYFAFRITGDNLNRKLHSNTYRKLFCPSTQTNHWMFGFVLKHLFALSVI